MAFSFKFDKPAGEHAQALEVAVVFEKVVPAGLVWGEVFSVCLKGSDKRPMTKRSNYVDIKETLYWNLANVPPVISYVVPLEIGQDWDTETLVIYVAVSILGKTPGLSDDTLGGRLNARSLWAVDDVVA